MTEGGNFSATESCQKEVLRSFDRTCDVGIAYWDPCFPWHTVAGLYRYPICGGKRHFWGSFG